MLINQANLSTLFTAFNASYTRGFENAPSQWEKVATKVTSGTREEEYGWVAQQAGIREWIGDRVAQSLALHGFKLRNRKFEYTVTVGRDDVADDRAGVFAPQFERMGQMARQHPDELVFSLLGQGFTELAYDGQFFFDTDHPVVDANGAEQSVSNFGGGALSPWFLIDASKPVRPLIWQEREPYQMQRLDKDNDENVFNRDEFLYGIRARGNAGFGPWQLAYASKQDLTADEYANARTALARMTADGGRKLNITGTVLVVPPELEQKARQLLNGGSRVVDVAGTPVAVTNEWQGTAELVVTPFVDA